MTFRRVACLSILFTLFVVSSTLAQDIDALTVNGGDVVNYVWGKTGNVVTVTTEAGGYGGVSLNYTIKIANRTIIKDSQPQKNGDPKKWEIDISKLIGEGKLAPGEYTIEVDASVSSTKQAAGAGSFNITGPRVDILCSHSLLQDEAAIPPLTFTFSLRFTPAIPEADIATYRWHCNFHAPNINKPSFPYTTPDKKETGLSDYHWYGHGGVADDGYNDPKGGEDDNSLRWVGNVMRRCSYEPLCDVTLRDGKMLTAHLAKGTGSKGKYFYIIVNDDGKTKGRCTPKFDPP